MNDKPLRKAEVEETPTAAAPKTTKYIVQNGSIAPDGGAPNYHPGDVVELTAAMAKHYIALGRLAPYVEDDQ